MKQKTDPRPSEILPPQIESARLAWPNGIPVSEQFGDIFFSRENGLEESRYVFLKHNQLPERFVHIPPAAHFVIAETGFGTGHNFLAAWQAWLASKPSHTATLHFVSVERFPLTRDDLARALALWPELSTLAEQLIDAYPPLVQGVHRLVFNEGQVRLTLYFGDVLDALESLSFTADAWFLDGFAPSLNPEMWADQILTKIRDHSRPGTTVATFTSTGEVRRGLSDAGFDVEKVQGFGGKRDMLAGQLSGQLKTQPNPAPGSVAIIGAGIAGCLLAKNLADRGIEVSLIDSATRAGTGASGNRQGAMYVKPGVEFNDQTRLALASLLFSQRFYTSHGGQHWHPTGLLQMAWSPREHERQQQLLKRNSYPADIMFSVNQGTASQLTGVDTPAGGIWFPGNGWIEPAKLCDALIAHPLINKVFNFSVDGLTSTDNIWRVSAGDHADILATRVVICAGHLSPELIPGAGIYRFKSIRGQVTHLHHEDLKAPNAVICGQRYVNPTNGGIAVTGATFDLRDDNPQTTEASHYENIMELQTMLPTMLRSPDRLTGHLDNLEGKTAFRCTTHDYQPVAGELYDAQENAVTGGYLLTGFGSKGLTYAPLLAEYVADILCNQPACLPASLVKRVRTYRMHRPTEG